MGQETVPMSRSSEIAVGTASTMACNTVPVGYKRTQVIITNTSAAAVITIVKSDNAAVAGYGIRLPPYGSYLESTDSGFTCWQGQVQVVADAAGTIAIVEQLEPA